MQHERHELVVFFLFTQMQMVMIIYYWLFYCTDKLDSVLCKNTSKRLWGYWLDAKNGKHELLHEGKSFIYNKNVLKCSMCPLYYTVVIPVEEGSIFMITETFHSTIMINGNEKQERFICNILAIIKLLHIYILVIEYIDCY